MSLRTLILSFVLALIVGCTTPRTDVVLRGGILDADGDIGASSGPVLLTSSARDLRLDSELSFQPRINVAWERWYLWADYSERRRSAAPGWP